MVQTILALAENERPVNSHASDALAVAICHAFAPPLLRAATLISRLRGTPVVRRPDGLVLDVERRRYLVAPTPAALRLAERGGEVSLETYLVVREDALQLYGFADAAERELFEHLISVNGVGPKVALAILSGSSVVRAPPRDRARGHRALRGDPRHRQEDGAAGRARAAREDRRRALELAAVAGSDGARSPATRSSSSAGRSSRPSASLADVDPELAPEERVREALRKAA